jgi:hypothetical protein
LAQSNKPDRKAKATKQQINPIRRNPRRVRAAGGQAMTLQEAKSIVRHLGLTLRKVRSGDYCVKSRDGNEASPYYTVDLEDAVNAAVRMARKASVMSVTTATQATPFSACHQQTFGAEQQIPARGQSD